jgi:hypothetical protein
VISTVFPPRLISEIWKLDSAPIWPLYPMQAGQPGDVLAGGVDDGVRPDSQRGQQPPGDDIGHGHLPHLAQLQPDHRPEPDGLAAEHDHLVGGAGSGPVHAVPGDRHRLVERGDLEGQGAGEDRDALACDGVLDEQVLLMPPSAPPQPMMPDCAACG